MFDVKKWVMMQAEQGFAETDHGHRVGGTTSRVRGTIFSNSEPLVLRASTNSGFGICLCALNGETGVEEAEKEGTRERSKMISGVVRRSAPRASAINLDWWVMNTSFFYTFWARARPCLPSPGDGGNRLA